MGSLDSLQVILGEGDYIISGFQPFRRRWWRASVPTSSRDHVDYVSRRPIVVLGFGHNLLRDGHFGSRSWPSNIPPQVALPDERFDFVLQLVALLGVMLIVSVVPVVLLHIPLC